MITHQGHCNCLYGMPLFISWQPTYHCNYHCSYCTQARPKGSDCLSLGQSLKIFDNLRSLGRDSYLICFSGGECTIYPHLGEIIRHIADIYAGCLDSLYIISNGSRNAKLYETLGLLSEKIIINLHISVHTDHAELDHIQYLIENLSKTISLNFNLMFNPAKLGKVREFHDLFMKLRLNHPFSLSIDTIREMNNGGIIDRRYRAEDFEWQKDASARFLTIHNGSLVKHESRGWPIAILANRYMEGGNHKYERISDRAQGLKDGKYILKDKYCVLGTHVVSIEPDGHASNAICGMRALSRRPLYEADPYEDPAFCRIVQCGISQCGCRANDNLQRFSNRAEAEDYLRNFQGNVLAGKSSRRRREKIEAQLRDRLESLSKADPELFPLQYYVDRDYYFEQYPDVRASGMDAADHYRLYGWKEKRNPNAWFNTGYYMSHWENPDVMGMNPLTHYILRGVLEGRSATPPPGTGAQPENHLPR